jgi:predicted GH43/DUF377 family glycosyl hydrolase
MLFSFLLRYSIVLIVFNYVFLCNGDYLSSTVVKSFSPNSSFPSFYFIYYENNDIFEIPDNYTLQLLSSELPSLSVNTISTVPYQLVPKILKSKGILPSLQQTSSDNTENSRVLLGELVERSLFIQDSSLVYLGPTIWNPSIVYWMGRYLVCWRDISSIYQGQLAFGWLTTDMKQIDSQSYLGIGGTNDEKKIHPIPFFKKPGAIEQEDPRLFLLSNGSLVISFTGFFPNPAKPHVRIGKNIQGYILANYHEKESKIVFQEKITIFDYKQGPHANRQKNWIPFEYHPGPSSSSSDRTAAASSSSLYFIQNIHQMKIFKTIHQLSSLVPAAPASPDLSSLSAPSSTASNDVDYWLSEYEEFSSLSSVYHPQSLPWKSKMYGNHLRGGTPAIFLPIQNLYLMLFHTSYNQGRKFSEYFMGVVTFCPFPPFSLHSLSSFPILRTKKFYTGDYINSYLHYVVYPSGLILDPMDNTSVIVSFGHQDKHGYLVKMNITSLLSSLTSPLSVAKDGKDICKK